ncbi:hypothetical protein [Saliphagus infecundisoli]|uniref:Uncharacterized protein n=1 Tax=Saliphagus infecundisoli TaxID=1849069 RepID=A0ABD5QIX4_9EURY|nr:hypothetical protein [Saliphagus infecundisoli]
MGDADGSFSRREYLLSTGAGSIAVLSGTAGCLGLGDDEQQAEEPGDETDENSTENESEDEDATDEAEETENESEDDEAEPENETVENESEDEDATDGEEVDDEGDGSILEEEESDENDSENDSEDKSEATENESEDEAGDGDTENGTADESQDTETPEEPQEDADNETDGNESEDEAAENESGDGASETDSEGDHEDSGTEEADEDGGFEQYTIEDLPYQVDYPADWEVDESNEGYVQIFNGDETARIWIETEEARLDLEQEVRDYRDTFEPEPSVEIHADDPVTLSSGEDGHRFVIEMTDRETNQIIAHELIAQANGIQYLTSVIISRSLYNNAYAQLAEKILASVALG